MPCILLALPNPALPFMAAVPDTEKRTGDRPRWSALRPGPFGHLAAECRHRVVPAGRGRSGGEFHRPVPDGRRHPAAGGGGRAGGRDPRCRGPGVRLPRDRAGPARQAGDPGPDPECRLGRDQRVHERHRRRARLAEPGHLGHAPHRLRPGQRHLDRRRPGLGPGPPPAADRRAGRRGGHPAGRARRADLVAAAPGPGPRLHPGRVPRLGARGMPGRPRPPRRSPPRPAVRQPQAGGSRGRRPRPPGSFLWSPNGTALLPPSPWIASPRSAPPWPQPPT